MNLDKNSILATNWRMFYCLVPFQYNPQKEWYGLEIEKELKKRSIKISHESVINYLNHYSNTNILKREKKGRQVFFSINKEKIINFLVLLEQDKTNLFMKKTKNIEIIEISQLIKKCYFALVFGSVSRREDRKSSDLDILVVDGVLDNEKLEKKKLLSDGEINISKVSLKELQKRWHKEPVYKSLWHDRILIKNPYNFWKFVLEDGSP